MKSLTVEINVGDEIQVGRFRNVSTKIKSIEFDEHGQPVLVTSKGKKKLFTCRLQKLDPGSLTPKQIMERKKKK